MDVIRKEFHTLQRHRLSIAKNMEQKFIELGLPEEEKELYLSLYLSGEYTPEIIVERFIPELSLHTFSCSEEACVELINNPTSNVEIVKTLNN